MRVLLVNTSEQIGGAAIAATRLTNVLNRHGVEARLLVRDKQTSRATTVRLPQRLRLRAAFLWERLRIWAANGLRRTGLWTVDIACCGVDITQLPEFREADIIHLHWVNQGLLSLHQIGKILASGKPLVWTMHDMWPCTAVCHHARECRHFHTHCHDCPQLLSPAAHDLSWQVFEKKVRAYAQARMTFVACSQWLAGEARKSALLEGHEVLSIPNTYDSALFHPASQAEARRRLRFPARGRLLLFASQKVTNSRKGLDILYEALQSSQLADLSGDLHLVVVGQMAEGLQRQLPFPVHAIGYLSAESDMAALYQAVDVFVTPSLEENLPNTIMEAMASGTPCVGFQIGGIPEMIDHLANGYVARYRDADDLALGIRYVLENQERLAQNAVAKAAATWNEDTVARQHIKLYEQLREKIEKLKD